MGKAKDLTGQRFGKLIAVTNLGLDQDRRSISWLCKCDCGNEKTVKSRNLLKGKTKSCGCLKKEIDYSNRNYHKKHGMYKSRLYRIWVLMRERCYNTKRKDYQRYGKLGIKVCEEWTNENGFVNFMNWALANGYKDNLSIDRIENKGNYEPSNCRWASDKTQANNTKRNNYIEYNGEVKTATEWAREFGLNPSVVNARLRRGWTGERLFEPSNRK